MRSLIALLIILANATYAQVDTTTMQTKETMSSSKIVKNKLYHNVLGPISNTTLSSFQSSSGFYSFNKKGFANSFTYGMQQSFDGFSDASILFNAPMADFLIPILDIDQLELSTNTFPNTIGSGINGMASFKSLDPFEYQEVSGKHEAGANSALGFHQSHHIKYAQAFGKKQNIALKLNAGFTQSAEWKFDDDNSFRYASYAVNVRIAEILRRMQYEPIGPGFTQDDKDQIIKLNGWLDFNPIASPGTIKVNIPQTYSDNDWQQSQFRNIHVSPSLHFKFKKNIQLSILYRLAWFNTIAQPFFRYQLKDYSMHQPAIELKGKDFFVRMYSTIENSGNSYNMHRTGYHINNVLTPRYAVDYTNRYIDAYFDKLDTLTGFCADCVSKADVDSARAFARSKAAMAHFATKGDYTYDSLLNKVTHAYLPLNGSTLIAKSKSFSADAEYAFGFIKVMNLAIGATYNLQILENNEWKTDGKMFHNAGAYLNGSVEFWKKRFKVSAAGKLNYNNDFGVRGDHGAALSFNMKGQSVYVSSSSGYTFPTYAQRYTALKDMAPAYFGNSLKNDKWYTYTSCVDAWTILDTTRSGDAVMEATRALKVFTAEKLKPQNVYTIEAGMRNEIVKNKVWVNVSGFYNWITNVTALAFLLEPGTDSTDAGTVGEESGETEVFARNVTPFVTWTNLPIKTNSWGASAGVNYAAYRTLMLYVNYGYFGHKKIMVNDPAILSFNDFNMPEHKINAGIRANEIWKGLGFAVNFRWVSGYNWMADFGAGRVDAYHTMDIRLQYKIEKVFTTVYVGADNIYNNRHTEVPYSPRVGAWYYGGLLFAFELKKK